MKRIDLTLVLPCYNEEPVFEDSVRRILSVLDNSRLTYEIIFVDDKSQDRTPFLIKQAVKKRKNLRAIFHNRNAGRGVAVRDGVRAGRGLIAGYIDIDLEVSPVYIPEIVRSLIRGDSDLIIGQRIYRTNLPSVFREILSVGYRKLSDRLVGTGGLDTESGYKFFRRRKILKVLSHARHPHWFFDTELVVYSRLAGLNVTEVPVLFIRRFDKKSSVRVFSDTRDYLVNLWKLRGRLNR